MIAPYNSNIFGSKDFDKNESDSEEKGKIDRLLSENEIIGGETDFS